MKRQLTLKLIESNDKVQMGDLVRNPHFGIRQYTGDFMIGRVVKPIAISDEEIKSKDYVLINCSEAEIVNDIQQVYSVSNSYIYFEDGSNIGIEYCKKIELLHEHFSNDILQLIVDGKLKDGDTIEVAIDTYNNQIMFDERGCASISIPESNINEVSKIMYSEESILNIIDEVEEELMKEVEGDFEYNGVSHYIELLKERLKK